MSGPLPQRSQARVGHTLAGTYRIEQPLGHGGMGAVYVARHARTGGLFAVKILHHEAAQDAEVYRRFMDEARTTSALRHPHIVQVTDFDQEPDGTPFIVMELLDGEDLARRLRRTRTLQPQAVLELARQVGSALQAAHDSGVVHRDIKPQNIFLCRHRIGDILHENAKVVDFGISKIRHEPSQATSEQLLLGTPHYMSPEAALGQNSQLDGRADQFSLAVILYQALSGSLPFQGEHTMGVLYQVVHEQPVPLSQLVPGLPAALLGVIERALSKRKEDRFPTMAEFLRALPGASPSLVWSASAALATIQMPSLIARPQPASVRTPAPEAPAPVQTPRPEATVQVQTPRPMTPAPVQTPRPLAPAPVQTPAPDATALIQTPPPSALTPLPANLTTPVPRLTPTPSTLSEANGHALGPTPGSRRRSGMIVLGVAAGCVLAAALLWPREPAPLTPVSGAPTGTSVMPASAPVVKPPAPGPAQQQATPRAPSGQPAAIGRDPPQGPAAGPKDAIRGGKKPDPKAQQRPTRRVRRPSFDPGL